MRKKITTNYVDKKNQQQIKLLPSVSYQSPFLFYKCKHILISKDMWYNIRNSKLSSKFIGRNKSNSK